MASQSRGKVVVNADECKGCGVCVHSCPSGQLALRPELNHYGVHPAEYKGEACTACGVCFYVCPEPGAISVYRLKAVKAEEASYAATL